MAKSQIICFGNYSTAIGPVTGKIDSPIEGAKVRKTKLRRATRGENSGNMEPSKYGPFDYVPLPNRPRIEWPGGARVAVWIILNVEYFPLDQPIRAAPDTPPMSSAGASATIAAGSASGAY